VFLTSSCIAPNAYFFAHFTLLSPARVPLCTRSCPHNAELYCLPSNQGDEGTTPLYSRISLGGSGADSLFNADVSAGPVKKAWRHRLRGYFSRRGTRIFYATYLVWLLIMVMIFVVLHTQVCGLFVRVHVSMFVCMLAVGVPVREFV